MEYRPIQKLSEEIVGKIAAGEVVESPAAAIKELVENSIDAGATNITVEIRDGGITYLRVSDNGSGIHHNDVRMAFERHATSKIRKADDLFNLSSLGFRGEALASIAAVSKVMLTTRTKADERGTRVLCEGGNIREIVDAASPEGTTIVARELFYNTPVRLKFLKKPATEGARVADMVMRLIVSHPHIAFRLIHNEKQIYMSPGNGDMRSVAFCLYGRDAATNMQQISGGGSIGVKGLVGVGSLARSNRTHQTFIINGRYVRSALLTQAIEAACKERVTIGYYPICLLQLDMSGAMVDVNVHPNKLEVRFSNEALVFENVKGAIADSFNNDVLAATASIKLTDESKQERRQPVPPVNVEIASPDGRVKPSDAASDIAREPKADQRVEQVEIDEPTPQAAKPIDSSFSSLVSSYFSGETLKRPAIKEAGTSFAPHRALDFAPYFDHNKKTKDEPEIQPTPEIKSETIKEASPASEQQEPAVRPATQVAAPVKPAFPFKILGIAFNTYIILEQADRILLVDQHAAHERVLYERMMKTLSQGGGSQMLLVAQVVHVTAQEQDRLQTYAAEIREAGFEIEAFGDDTVRIVAVPLVLGAPQAKAAFVDLLDKLGNMRVLSTQEKRRDAILQTACKHAIKGGDKLSAEEVVALLGDMLASDSPPTCPHGRPLVVTLSRTEIEKKFRRINS